MGDLCPACRALSSPVLREKSLSELPGSLSWRKVSTQAGPQERKRPPWRQELSGGSYLENLKSQTLRQVLCVCELVTSANVQRWKLGCRVVTANPLGAECQGGSLEISQRVGQPHRRGLD